MQADQTLSAKPNYMENREDTLPPVNLARAGTYKIGFGSPLGLEVTRKVDFRSLEHLLAPLSTDQKSAAVLQYGHLVEASSNSQRAIKADLRGLWRDGKLIRAGPPPVDTTTPALTLVFEFLQLLLAQHPVAAVLHGAAVLWRGRRIVIVGVSGAGKSTLAAQLVADDGAYLADDYVVILQDGSILSVPLAPSIKEGAWPTLTPLFPQLSTAPVFGKGDVKLKYLSNAPSTLASGVADLVVFPKFSRQASAKAVPLSEVEMLLNLSQSGLWLQPIDLELFLSQFNKIPALAIRQTPDFELTKALLTEALNKGGEL